MAARKKDKSTASPRKAGGTIADATFATLGVALLTAAVANAAENLSKLGLPLPAPGTSPPARVAFAALGLALLTPVLIRQWDPTLRPAVVRLGSWWRERTAPRPPARDIGLPPDRNPLFRGRETELEHLRQRLRAEKRIDLRGLGGVGKSQLAIEYLHLHRGDYPDGAFWLRGETAATLAADFAALAWPPHLQLEERHLREQERVIEAVMGWLRAHERWLLAIDNLDEPSIPTLNSLLARGLAGHVVVTSRVPVWDQPALEVEPMPLEVATAFLLERSGQTDGEAAATVAEIVGGLPLALVQAAGYLRTSGRDLASYAELLRGRLGELLGQNKPADYPLTVAATWQLSFERIDHEHAPAAALLRLCAFLAPNDIPISLLLEAADELPKELRTATTDQIRLDRAIGELRRYAILDRQGDELRVHRLVQAVVRESLPNDLRQQWTGAAVRVVSAAFPVEAEDPQLWQACAHLLPHAQIATDQAEELMQEPRRTSWLLDRVAMYLRARGELLQARRLFERALAIRERVLGPEDPLTGGSLNNLALLLQDQGDFAGARRLCERALDIAERGLGPNHRSTARALDNLALVLQAHGDLAAARPLFERALDIRERGLGPDHPDTARGLNNLASLIQAQGDLAAARPLFERAQGIWECVLGPDDPDTARGLNNLALLLQAQGELDAARPLFERALDIRERVLGPDHPSTARGLNNLGCLLGDQRELADARSLLERALVIRERVLGPDHPDTASSFNNLARLVEEQGNLAGARLLFERALDVAERVLGPDHPLTNNARRSLEALTARRNEPPDAPGC